MNKAIASKILITLGFLFLYRVLAYIPIPGVDLAAIKAFFDSNSNNALGLFNMFSGNAVSRLSIISLGIMPYITSSIIMELLSATFPNLAKNEKRARRHAKIHANRALFDYFNHLDPSGERFSGVKEH
ncbi:secY translocase family protein [Helicobacter pylori SouthAfrica50]|uniref:SecY translocase family protein n=1 Tax=Helicobacter pylori SouthAfrica50 TaxID=1352357 RepID=T2SB81_HELPX|nr:secY translocase family protein [Helicobacter pylori SouthAfrica50]